MHPDNRESRKDVDNRRHQMTAYSSDPAYAAPAAPATTMLQRLLSARQAGRLREENARAYRNLLSADDHTLSDLGVTRLDVLKLLKDLDTA
jgi:uncharacterized protein YjiS (DUF1127 family)